MEQISEKNTEDFEYTLENKEGRKFRVKIHREIKENPLELI